MEILAGGDVLVGGLYTLLATDSSVGGGEWSFLWCNRLVSKG